MAASLVESLVGSLHATQRIKDSVTHTITSVIEGEIPHELRVQYPHIVLEPPIHDTLQTTNPEYPRIHSIEDANKLLTQFNGSRETRVHDIALALGAELTNRDLNQVLIESSKSIVEPEFVHMQFSLIKQKDYGNTSPWMCFRFDRQSTRLGFYVQYDRTQGKITDIERVRLFHTQQQVLKALRLDKWKDVLPSYDKKLGMFLFINKATGEGVYENKAEFLLSKVSLRVS